MKLAHLADLHLGFRQFNRQTSQGINQREADVAQAFRAAVDDVVTAAPDLIVVSGDIFHSVRPPNPAILDSFNQFRRLRQALPTCPIVLLGGNHDTPRSVETGAILKLFEAITDVHVAHRDPETFRFTDLDLTITCLPYAGVVTRPRPTLRPDPEVKWNVLAVHGEIAGVVPGDRSYIEHAGAMIEPGDLRMDRWNYVALGHYHVASEVAPNAWYAGSLEYVTHNPWSELREGAHLTKQGPAKGWLLVSLADVGVSVKFRPVPLARRHIDLEPIHAAGLTAPEIDRLLGDRVTGITGGLADQVVRQLVYDVSRTVARELDHVQIRQFKARALHYRFDVRRPAPVRDIGVSAPGQRQTLDAVVEEYLTKRPVAPGIDRTDLLRLARDYLARAEPEVTEP